jgi:hypothetical protein
MPGGRDWSDFLRSHYESARGLGVLAALVAFSFLGCTSISVQPLDISPRPTHVCIESNPKVLVTDFVPVVQDGLTRHGMSSQVFRGVPPANCDLVLSYTARRSWDFAPYLAQAELWLRQDGKQVGYAEYHLVGGGGLSLMKWQGTKTKMDPVIDQLLSGE